jgi:hypothetical protein
MAKKRELIEPMKGDRRLVRRGTRGRFKEVDDPSRSFSQDPRRNARAVSTHGQNAKGDRK